MNYSNPYDDFHRNEYILHNESRQEHLSSLDIKLTNKSILEVGAGIGDHTEYLLTHNPNKILCLEARKDNIKILENKFNEISSVSSQQFDMESPTALNEKYDICYCYGLLYHLGEPEKAIEFMAAHTKETLLLETCVDYKNENEINLTPEDVKLYSQSYTGTGCRPGRIWLFEKLKEHFEHVYIPLTQPNHEQFPTDWNKDIAPNRLNRSVFIASRNSIENSKLTNVMPYTQTVTNETTV